MQPQISIITVCYNASKFIEKAITSVLNQTYPRIEYIIVDGNSTDGTQKIVQKYLDKIAKYVSEADTGIYNAMNKGINLSTGDYIYFLGADDYLIDKNVIENVSNFIIKYSYPQLVYGNIETRSEHKLISNIHKPPVPEYILDELVCSCLPHQATFAHRQLFNNPSIGLFNESYKTASDYEWFLKIASTFAEDSQQICYYDRVIASYSLDGASGKVENMVEALTEMFAIQDAMPIYQTNDWLKRRIEKYQQILINPNGFSYLIRLPPNKFDYITKYVFPKMKTKTFWIKLFNTFKYKMSTILH